MADIKPYTKKLKEMAQFVSAGGKEAVLTQSFDYIIDRDFEDGKRLFARLGSDIEYQNSKDFLNKVTLGEHPSSLASISFQIKENSTKCRDRIYSHAFSYANRAYLHLKGIKEKTIEIYDIEKFLEHLLGFDGTLSSALIKSEAAKLIELGKRVERVDLEARLFDDITVILFEIDEINALAKSLRSDFKKISLTTDDKAKIIKLANSIVDRIIQS